MSASRFVVLRARAAVSRWKIPPRSVRWVGTSGTCLRATESELKVSAILKDKLNPTYLHVEDVSCGCGDKFNIHIDSEQFRGKRLVQQHRLVNEALGEEMKTIHAVSIMIGDPTKDSAD